MTDIRKQFYENIDSFWHDLYDEEYALYDIKVEKAEKIKQVKTAADRVGHVFFKTAHLLRALDDETLQSLGFPKEVLPYIRLQTMEVETVISRIDFIVNESGIKVMELNADTPTFIKELFHVNRRVCKQFGLHDPNQKEEEHLSRVLKEAIFKAYEKLGKTTYPHIVFSSHGDHEEDKWTTMYLMEQANVKARYEPLDKLRIVDKPIHEQGGLILESGLYDTTGQKIDVLYRQTYPIEHLVNDRDPVTDEGVGEMLLKLVKDKQLAIINPPSAFLLQSKAIQVVIWGLYEQKHPFFTKEEHEWIYTYFLPTYLEEDVFIKSQKPYVKKPSFGREGDTVEIYEGSGKKVAEDAQKTYEDEVPVYQQFLELDIAEIVTEKGKQTAHIMYGCFLLNGRPSAVGIRAGNQITDNASYYLPIGLKNESEDEKNGVD